MGCGCLCLCVRGLCVSACAGERRGVCGQMERQPRVAPVSCREEGYFHHCRKSDLTVLVSHFRAL